jgi:hypothetical protein
MKSNVVYVDFTHKKVLNNNSKFSLKQIKEHIKNIFYFITNRLNSFNSCKRIPSKRYFS